MSDLQDSNQMIYKLYRYINVFEKKLKLLENQMQRKTFYINFVQDLRQQFVKRFADIHSTKEDFKLFFQPFDVQPESANKSFLMELNELQSNKLYKSNLAATSTSVIEFSMKFLNKSKCFTYLLDHAKKFICIFESTFCEQLFSKMK